MSAVLPPGFVQPDAWFIACTSVLDAWLASLPLPSHLVVLRPADPAAPLTGGGLS